MAAPVVHQNYLKCLPEKVASLTWLMQAFGPYKMAVPDSKAILAPINWQSLARRQFGAYKMAAPGVHQNYPKIILQGKEWQDTCQDC